MYLGVNSKGEIIERSPNGERGFKERPLQRGEEKKVKPLEEPKRIRITKRKKVRRPFYDQQTGAFEEAVAYHKNLGPYRDLGGTIGDGLAPHCTPAEVIGDTFASDFGLSGRLGAEMGGVGDYVGDQLESLIRKVIEVRAKIEIGDDAFFKRMKALPASDAKKREIERETARIKARDSGTLANLYSTFSSGVVAALDKKDPARAQRLKFLFDNPRRALAAGHTLDTTLADDGLGVIPVLAIVGVAGAIGGAGATYVATAKPEIDVANKHLSDLASIAKDTSQSPETRAIAAKALAESTKEISTAARETAGGLLGGISGTARTLTLAAIALALVFAFVKIGIPMLQKRQGV